MSKTAFVLYELHFYKDSSGNVWSKKLVNYDFLQRYLCAFDQVMICARISSIEMPSSNMMKVSGPGVLFCELPDTKGVNETLKKLTLFKRIIKRALLSCDCIITRSPSMLFILLANTLLKAKKPISTDVALSADCLIDGRGLIKKICNRLIDLRYRRIIKRINGVSYVTEYVLQKKYPCKAIFSPSERYFTSSFSTIVLKGASFYHKKWEENAPAVVKLVHCGFMEDDRKCQTKVLKIVKMLTDDGYNVTIDFIGDGAMKNKLINLSQDYGIQDRCNFLGLISNQNALLEKLRESHFFIFPTKAEGLPRSLIEAMSQGLVCISSPVDGVVELLENDKLIDWRKPENYVKKIEELIDNWHKMKEESEKNYLIAQKYSEEKLRVKREDFYKKLSVIS